MKTLLQLITGIITSLVMFSTFIFVGCSLDKLDPGYSPDEVIEDGFNELTDSVDATTAEVARLRNENDQNSQSERAQSAEENAALLSALERPAETETPNADPDFSDLPHPDVGDRDLTATYNDLNDPLGFVWKPISENDGNLVILLAPRPSGSPVRALSIFGSFGIEVGTYVGLTNPEGSRPTFRFSKPGCFYGTRILIETGDSVSERQTIPVGCNRYDGGDGRLP